MRQYMYPEKYRDIEPSNHRLAHNPTALLFCVLQKTLKGCVIFKRPSK